MFVLGIVVIPFLDKIYELWKKRGFSRTKYIKLAKTFNFHQDVINLLWSESRGKIKQLVGFNSYGEEKPVKGFSFFVNEEDAEKVLDSLKKKLQPSGYLIFFNEKYLGQSYIGVYKSKDKYSIVKKMQTNGSNHRLTNKHIIEKLQTWDESYPFDIIGAGFDWVEIKFENLPYNLEDFALDINKFCPFEEYETIEDLIRSLENNRTLLLWWD